MDPKISTTATNAVAKAAGIPLGMHGLCGKEQPKGTHPQEQRYHGCGKSEPRLARLNSTSIWFFQVTVQSMWYSKVQLGRTVEAGHHVMQEIMKMLTHESSEGGRAVFARGSAEMASARGATFLTCMQEYNSPRKDQVEPKKGGIPFCSCAHHIDATSLCCHALVRKLEQLFALLVAVLLSHGDVRHVSAL